MKLTNEEIARVFAMYYGCKCQRFNNDDDYNMNRPVDAMTISRVEGYRGGDHKLHLQPLSSITDEHAKDLWSIQGYEQFNNEHTIKTVNRWLGDKNIGYDQQQYLIQQGYAVPLFFGLNHWANGKTAIELGVAIEQKTLCPS